MSEVVKKKKKPTPVPVEQVPVKKKKPIPVAQVQPDHAVLSPSYSKTWLACPASLAAGMDEPNVSGAAAVEGTLCHQVLEHVINRLIHAGHALPHAIEGDGTAAEHYVGIAWLPAHPKVKFSEDHARLLSPVIAYVKGLMDDGYTIFPEMRINLSRVLNVPGTFGTADIIAFKGDHLIVGDLKVGRHPVAPGTLAELNPQMGLYGVGVLDRYSATREFKSVSLVIIQPRAGGMKTLDNIPAEALIQFGKFAASRAAKAMACVDKGKKKLVRADFRPTPGGCQWCRFRDKCSVKLSAAAEVPTKGIEISDAELLEAYRKLPLLESQISSTKAEMEKRLLAGRTIGEFRLVEGRPGARKWKDESAAEQYLTGELFDKAFERKLISPTTAAKLLPDTSKLDELVTRAEGKSTIAGADDARKTYSPVSDGDLDD